MLVLSVVIIAAAAQTRTPLPSQQQCPGMSCGQERCVLPFSNQTSPVSPTSSVSSSPMLRSSGNDDWGWGETPYGDSGHSQKFGEEAPVIDGWWILFLNALCYGIYLRRKYQKS